jgi:hypothetical protein
MFDEASGTYNECKRHAKLKIAQISALALHHPHLCRFKWSKTENFFPESKHFLIVTGENRHTGNTVVFSAKHLRR